MTTKEFLGVWHRKADPERVYVFGPDGTLTIGKMKDGKNFDSDAEVDHWSLQASGELTVTFAGSSDSAPCNFDADALVITPPNSQRLVRLVRSLAKPTPRPEYPPLPKPPANSPLVGVWQNQDPETKFMAQLTFCPDGTYEKRSAAHHEEGDEDFGSMPYHEAGTWSYDGKELTLQYHVIGEPMRGTSAASLGEVDIVESGQHYRGTNLMVDDRTYAKTVANPPATIAATQTPQEMEQRRHALDSLDDQMKAVKLIETASRVPTPAPKAMVPSTALVATATMTANGSPAVQPTPETAARAVPARVTSGRSVSAAEVNGTWKSQANEIKVLALGQGKLRVQFDLTKPVGKSANTGFASGEAAIEDDVASFTPPSGTECTIIITFLPGGRLQVRQNGYECGFGRNVDADGIYQKVSGAKPTFDNTR